jgi:hypothetical protein
MPVSPVPLSFGTPSRRRRTLSIFRFEAQGLQDSGWYRLQVIHVLYRNDNRDSRGGKRSFSFSIVETILKYIIF